MIDTHVHLNHNDLLADLPGVLERATAAGVTGFIVVGYDLASSERAVKIAEGDSRIFAVVGIHPHDATSWGKEAGERLYALTQHPRVTAIGEIGLDFYRDLSPRDVQREAFRAQLEMANFCNLPVVIHCRDAYDETLDILEAEAVGMKIILHCFLGDATQAQRAFSHGWYIGVDGPITFKKNDDLRAIVRTAPQESLLLETDAPYLSPEPLRGKHPNEPARLPYIAAKIAAVRGETPAQVAAYTTENAKRVLSIEC